MESTPTKVTLRALCRAFMLSRQHLSPHTLEYYNIILAKLEWFAARQDWLKDAQRISREHIRKFLVYVTPSPEEVSYLE